MLAVVKKPHTKKTAFKIVGTIDKDTISFLNDRFGKSNITIQNEQVDIKETAWYKNLKVTPGEKLKIYRKNADMTQSELAKKAGVSGAAYISKIERGSKTISKRLAYTFSEIFGVTVGTFF